jgi:hypothetical protein
MSNILQGLNKTQAHDGAFLLTESRTYKLWESAGQKIVEAQLTADQINQIFQQVEQGATAGGGNRTMLGKGKDAAGAVKKAYDDLVSKVQNSGPIKGVDAMYDNAAEKLKQATGGDQGVMKYVQKYRDFAKEHPVAQSLIYSALIAAAGISGAGIGGAAALGLFKMVDKLLQGEKFSTAVGKGATTGAMAYGASKVGDLFRGSPQGAPTTAGSDATAGAAQDTLSATRQAVEKEAMDAIKSRIANGEIAPGDQGAIRDLAYKMLDGSGMPPQAIETSVEKLITRSMGDVGSSVTNLRGQANESIDLTESQIFLMIGKIVERQRKIDEGIMDTLKGAAGKAADWAKTKGTNLTTKVTADKLLQAWKKAGSPTDSLDVASIIQKSGVPSDSIKQVYTTMQIPFAGEKGAGASTKRNIDVDPSSVAPGAPTSAPIASAPSATANAPAADASQAAPAATGSLAQAQELIAKLDPETKTKLISTLKQELSVAESKDEYGPEYQAMVQRVGQMAKQGERKTVWDPVKRVYKTVPVNTPKDKEVDEAFDNYHANRTGFTRPKRDLSGEGEPEGMFMVMIDGRPWKEFTSNIAFSRAKTLADKNPSKKIQVKWPSGQLNTVSEDELDENCWKGYHKEGNKKLFGKTVPNCVKNEGVAEEEDKMDSRFKKTEWMPLMNAIKILKHYGATPEKYMGHDMFPYYDREGNRKYLEDITWNADNSKNVRVSLVNAAVRELRAQQQGVAEGSESSDNLVSTLNSFGYYSDNGNVYVNDDSGDKIARQGSNWKHQSGKRGAGAEELGEFLGSKQGVAEEKCPHCSGPMFSELMINEKKDACYYKVKSRYKVWPSAYASGALVKCRNKGADSWGNGGKKNEGSILEGINRADESLHDWFNKEKWVRMDTKGNIKGPCAKEPGEGKPKCLPQAKAHSLGKKGRASAAQRKRREDPNPDRSGKAINVNTKKKSNENVDEGWKEKLGAAALTGAMALGAAGAQARVTPGDDPNINRLTGKPNITQPAQTQTPTKAEAPKGFSKEYLQSVVNGTHPRPMISVEKAQELLKQGQ